MGLCQEQGAHSPSHRAAHPALPGPGTGAVRAAPSLPRCSLPPRGTGSREGRSSRGRHTLLPSAAPQPVGTPAPPPGTPAWPRCRDPGAALYGRDPNPGPRSGPPAPLGSPPGSGPGSPPRGPGAAAGSRQPGWFPSGPGWIPAPPRGPPGIPAPTDGPPLLPPVPAPHPRGPGTPGLPWGPTAPHRGCPHSGRGMEAELP